MSITLDSVVVAGRDQVSAELSGEAIVLGLDKGMYYGLDEVAALVWGMVAEPRPVSEIRDRILAVYEVDEETCRRDLLRFLEHLRQEGLVEVRDAQSS